MVAQRMAGLPEDQESRHVLLVSLSENWGFPNRRMEPKIFDPPHPQPANSSVGTTSFEFKCQSSHVRTTCVQTGVE